MKDYYKILEIQPSSSSSDIKRAYRTLSKKYHPDINKNGIEQFKAINEANAVLSDTDKRKEYDIKYNAHFKPKTAQKATQVNKANKPSGNTNNSSANTIIVNGVKINVTGNHSSTFIKVVNGKVVIETS